MFIFKKKYEILTVMMFLCVGFYFFSLIKERKKMLNGDFIYTVAKITSIEYGPRTSPVYKYIFQYDKKSYESVFSLSGNGLKNASKNERNNEIGKHYLVKVSTLKPKFNELFFGKVISDSLVKCCFGDSWNEIPEPPDGARMIR